MPSDRTAGGTTADASWVKQSEEAFATAVVVGSTSQMLLRAQESLVCGHQAVRATTVTRASSTAHELKKEVTGCVMQRTSEAENIFDDLHRLGAMMARAFIAFDVQQKQR